MKSKSYIYYLFAFILILLVFISSILFLINGIVTKNSEIQIESRINQTQIFMTNHINHITENKINICKILAKNEYLISAIQNNDTTTLDSIATVFSNPNKEEYFLITDSENNILKRLNLSNGSKDYIHLFPAVHEFLNNNYKQNSFKSSFLLDRNKYHLVFTVPVTYENKIIGTLSKGYDLNSTWQIEKFTNCDVSIHNRSLILFSTLDIRLNDFQTFIENHIPIFDAVSATLQASELIFTELAEKEIYCKIIPFGGGIPAYIMISIPKSNEFIFLHKLLEYIVYIFLLFSIMILFTFLIYVKHQSKKARVSRSELQSHKRTNENERDRQRVLTGMVLVSNIVCDEKQINGPKEDVINNYRQIQSELVELYDGFVGNIKINNLVGFFPENKNGSEKALECARAIMKIIKKESETTKCKIAIGLDYGLIDYSEDTDTFSGESLKKAQSITDVTKPGQILIQKRHVQELNQNSENINSKVWKLKYFEEEVILVDIAND